MEEQQVRWNQSSLRAAEEGFGVAEGLLLGHHSAGHGLRSRVA